MPPAASARFCGIPPPYRKRIDAGAQQIRSPSQLP
jgi:hypothetical protein